MPNLWRSPVKLDELNLRKNAAVLFCRGPRLGKQGPVLQELGAEGPCIMGWLGGMKASGDLEGIPECQFYRAIFQTGG